MESIPLVRLRKRKIQTKGEQKDTLNYFLEKRTTDTPVYFYDEDGIKNDTPNLCLYQKLGKQYNIWADAGPRTLGDVVDLVLAGATQITIRKNLWRDVNISAIREITENKIYTCLLYEKETFTIDPSFINETDGCVIFTSNTQIESDFKAYSTIKQLSAKTKIYLYDSNHQQSTLWQKLGITGLLIDFNHIKEFQ